MDLDGLIAESERRAQDTLLAVSAQNDFEYWHRLAMGCQDARFELPMPEPEDWKAARRVWPDFVVVMVGQGGGGGSGGISTNSTGVAIGGSGRPACCCGGEIRDAGSTHSQGHCYNDPEYAARQRVQSLAAAEAIVADAVLTPQDEHDALRLFGVSEPYVSSGYGFDEPPVTERIPEASEWCCGGTCLRSECEYHRP